MHLGRGPLLQRHRRTESQRGTKRKKENHPSTDQK
jgi:hypothetical protein